MLSHTQDIELNKRIWQPYLIYQCRGRGPRGARGARAPLKIGDLYSKFFGKRQNLIFLFIRAPLEKNRSSAPDYTAIK